MSFASNGITGGVDPQVLENHEAIIFTRSWMMSAADDQAGKQTVLSVLQDPSISVVKFSIGGISVEPSMYEKVRQAIVDSKIAIMVAPEMLPAFADGEYFPVLKPSPDIEMYDVLVLRLGGLGTNRNQQFRTSMAMVHECTHAGFDLLQVPNMTHADHEAGAYLAGSMFGVAKMMDMGGHPERVTQQNQIFAAAWSLARSIVVETPGSWREPIYAVDRANAIHMLYTAIINSPEYGPAARDKINNDGVGRPWKLPQRH
jgi:hypothetical protein